MSRFLITTLFFLACITFLLLANFNLIPDFIVKIMPLEVWQWLIVISLIVVGLAALGIFPLPEKQ